MTSAPGPQQIREALGLMTPLERMEYLALMRGLERGTRPNVLKGTFPEQLDYILDAAPFKASFCTRRAAKSYSVGLEYVDDSFNYPGAHYLFLMTVRAQAKRDFWNDVLKDIDRRYGVGMVFNESELVATMPNEAKIYVGGADSSSEEWRKLIAGKYRKVHIDEAQAFIHTDLSVLVYEAFKPAVAEYRGSIGLSGTPGMINKGLFYDVTRGAEKGWSLHRWNTSNNTAVAPRMDGRPEGETCAERWATEIAELKALKPGIEETPAFKRNYLGQWVIESDALVYRYAASRNDFDGKLPFIDGPGRWHYVLGIDLGYEDATAYVLWAFHDSDPSLYGVEVFKQSKMDVTAAALQAKSFAAGRQLDAMVIDGSNKQSVMEMSNRHSLSLTPADKTGKPDFIELMNADFITGNIKLSPACAGLRDEYASLIWDDKSTKRQEHAACDNHAADAGLYGWRYCYQYLSKRPQKGAAPGTKEWADAQQRAAFEKAQRDVLKGRLSAGQDWTSEDWGAGDNAWGAE